MTRLTDLQLVLLTTAARRADGSLLPPPDSVASQTARIRKAIQPLIKRALIVEGPADVTSAWRHEDDASIGVFITAAGREAIGVPAPEPAQAEPTPLAQTAVAKRSSKAAEVLALMQREHGATIDELIAATGWLPHTTRAALTGLRKMGHVIDRSKRNDMTCYSIAQAA